MRRGGNKGYLDLRSLLFSFPSAMPPKGARFNRAPYIPPASPIYPPPSVKTYLSGVWGVGREVWGGLRGGKGGGRGEGKRQAAEPQSRDP